MKIGIIGTGVFSVSIALSLADNKKNQIILWSENEKLVESFNKTKKLDTIFKDRKMPENISVSNSYHDVLDDVSVVFLLTSAAYIKNVCLDIKEIINKKVPVCIGSKGILDNGKIIYDVVHKILKNPLAVMGGPTFSEDVASLKPYGFTLASESKKAIKIIKSAFDLDKVYIETSNDIMGCSLSGCLKNVYAIGSGILSGLGYQESTKALYYTRVYQEYASILYHSYAYEDVLSQLAGFGDLVMSCTSSKSRNYLYGEMIGSKETKKKIKDFQKSNTIEGISTLEILAKKYQKKRFKTPIISTLYEIVFDGRDGSILVDAILKKNNQK